MGKAFKDQIETLKHELSDEKRSAKEFKRQLDEKARASETDISNVKKELERKELEARDTTKQVRELEDKISDIEEKWAKSKRINQQRKDKIDKLEQDLEKQGEKQSSGGSSWEVTKLNREIETLM